MFLDINFAFAIICFCTYIPTSISNYFSCFFSLVDFIFFFVICFVIFNMCVCARYCQYKILFINSDLMLQRQCNFKWRLNRCPHKAIYKMSIITITEMSLHFLFSLLTFIQLPFEWQTGRKSNLCSGNYKHNKLLYFLDLTEWLIFLVDIYFNLIVDSLLLNCSLNTNTNARIYIHRLTCYFLIL